jgi:hypothetical protein
MTGYVYFLRAGNDGPIKIGFSSTSVERRIHGNQVGCPHKLIFLGVMAGGADLEQRLHRVFRVCALRGEWFNPHRRLLAFIARNARPVSRPVAVKPDGLSPLAELAWSIDSAWRRRREFASAADLSEAYLSQILSGARPIERLPFGTAVSICRLAGLPLDVLARACSKDRIDTQEAA